MPAGSFRKAIHSLSPAGPKRPSVSRWTRRRGERNAGGLRLGVEGLETGNVEIDGAGRNAVGEEEPHLASHDEGHARRIVARMHAHAEHIAPEGQRRIEIAPGRQRDLADRADRWHRIGQMEKLVPQPQEATAFGFLIWKDWPIRSSTKSITEPPI